MSVTTGDPRRSITAHGLLASFSAATVLDAADAHTANTLTRLVRDDNELVALAIAFAVRAVRLGSVTVDLATVASTADVDTEADVDVESLPWPEVSEWIDTLAGSALVALGEPGDDEADVVVQAAAPLRLIGTRLALDRYWRHERAIAVELINRLTDGSGLETGGPRDDVLDRIFGPERDAHPDLQRRAAATAATSPLTVIAGGPGTGKTTTVAAILALALDSAIAGVETATDGPPSPRGLRVALAAPTGKAAARLTEAVHDQARLLAADGRIDPDVQRAIEAVEASTLHRLLGRAPGSNSRFRHNRTNQLPHNLVIIDEASMISLSMMAKITEAVRPTARLVLVGDPQQLSSVEAGAVLADIVGPAAGDAAPETLLAHQIVVLKDVHRFSGGIADLARAVETGDADAALDILSGADDVTWVDTAGETGPDHSRGDGVATTDGVRGALVDTAKEVTDAARIGDARTALDAMRTTQVLCAHRRGAAGVGNWRRQVEQWLAAEIHGYQPFGWYAGRPLLVTENDYSVELFNGDTGVVVAAGDETDPGRLLCAFERRGEIITISPSRLRAVETSYAMTIHKSQGSQFSHAIVALPDSDSRILTRELLYTAVTRARHHVTVIGSAEAIHTAVERPVQRASGLTQRLWA